MSEQGAALMCPACGESFEPPLGAARCFCPHCGKPVDVERTREAAGARVRKEALRAFAFVGGGAYVARGEPLMRDVRSASDLDAVDLERFGIEEILHLRESVAHYGLVPWHQATYKKACEEGWAPAPTNEFQKAIFDQVKADKERGPTNPITIKPPNAKK